MMQHKVANIKRDFAYAPLVAILNLGKGEEKVWLTLFTFQGMNDYCFPSLEAIRKRMGNCLSVSRISRVITQLQKKGWVEKWRKGRRNQYRICIPSDLLFQPDFSGWHHSESKVKKNNSDKYKKKETDPAYTPKKKITEYSTVASKTQDPDVDEVADKKWIELYSREWVADGRRFGMTPEFYHQFCNDYEVSDYKEYLVKHCNKSKEEVYGSKVA